MLGSNFFKNWLMLVYLTPLTFLYTIPVNAQSVDYGSLQSLFNEPVTTSATGKPQRVSEAPVAMKIISADDIRRSGAANIVDVLRTQSGLSVWRWTRSTADVNVRGYNQDFSPRLLVLVNGRQVYSDVYGNTLWENLPVQLSEIRQIEIVKGPNSALFGFNAVSGVINIITYNPLYDDVSKAAVTVGSKDYQQGHFIHTQKLGDKVGVRVSAGATRMDEFDAPVGEWPFYDPANHQMSVDSIIQLTDDSQLRMEGTKTYAKTTEYPVVYAPFNSKYNTNSFKVAYSANTDIGMLQANIFRNSQNYSSDGSILSTAGNKNNVTVAQLEDLFHIGNDHVLRLQAELRHNEYQGTLLPEAKVFYNVISTGGMWNWKINDSLAWTNALRLDHLNLGRSGPLVSNPVLLSNDDYDKNLNEVSYNSGLVWSATNKDTFRLSTARGIQVPSLSDYGNSLSLGPSIILGNPNLQAGIVTNYEIGYDRNIDSIAGKLRTNLFYQTTNHIKATDAISIGPVTQSGNIGNSSTEGVELQLEGAVGEHWDWDLGYVLQFADDDLTVNDTVITSPYNGADATPTHSINAHLGYAKDKWEVDVFAQYVSTYSMLNNNGDDYLSTDAGDNFNLSGRIGYKLVDGVIVSLSGQQLNHAKTTETSGPEREREIFLSLTSSF